MAWPKKGTRKLVVDGEDFLWHYSGHCPLCSDDVFTVGKPGAPHVLYIDPFPWNFEIRPRSIASAIRWAKNDGWSAEQGPTRAMGMNDATEQFDWLADGQRHRQCTPVTDSES